MLFTCQSICWQRPTKRSTHSNAWSSLILNITIGVVVTNRFIIATNFVITTSFVFNIRLVIKIIFKRHLLNNFLTTPALFNF